LAPAKTPSAIIERLNAAVSRRISSPELRETLARQGAEPFFGRPSHFAEEIRRELALWQDVAKKTGIRID
jgi:tripartite-type tricarboxylate transporter receptor subunit TctC